MVYTRSGILFSLKKEGNPDTWMGLENITLTDTKRQYCMVSLYEVPKLVKLIVTGSGIVVTRGWGERGWGIVFNGDRVLV